MDNEDRENEGDLIIAAEKITTEQMAFLIRYSRLVFLFCRRRERETEKRAIVTMIYIYSGYICAPTTGERLDELELPLMVERNTELMRTAYTVSCDYAHGTSTGISAHDRALTCRKLADPTAKPNDFMRPGHILPLRSVPGGTFDRFGHTEAAVDLCQLANLSPVACIGELIKEDDPKGEMARRDDCFTFAKKHDIKMITIKDIIAYKRLHTA